MATPFQAARFEGGAPRVDIRDDGHARSIADDGMARVAAGESAEAVAREAVDARNALKASTRENMPTWANRWAEWRNTRKYGDPLGPSYDDLIGDDKTPEDIIRGAGHTKSWINRLLGVS